MRRFPLGHRPDSKKYAYPSHHGLMAAPPRLATPDLTRFRKGEIWQSQYGMCTGESTTRCAQLWYAANGFGEEILLSGAWNYLVGLVGAFSGPGQDPDNPQPLADIGAEPGLEFQGLQNLGILLAQDFPGPELPGFDPQRMFRYPTPDDLVKAYDGRGLQWHEVSVPFGSSLQEQASAVMVRGVPVKIAMFVDSGVMQNNGEVVTSIDRNDPSGGGHDITLLDASHPDYAVLDNWWRVSPELAARLGIAEEPWGGPGGTWRISWDCLDQHYMQALAFTGAPLIRKAR